MLHHSTMALELAILVYCAYFWHVLLHSCGEYSGLCACPISDTLPRGVLVSMASYFDYGLVKIDVEVACNCHVQLSSMSLCSIVVEVAYGCYVQSSSLSL